ncbi:MAG: M48 family metallopeptidase [Anaerolineae bacterium]
MSSKCEKLFRWLFVLSLLVVFLSPLVYWSTGIGQAAGDLSAQPGRTPDGTLTSSPKAEALHRLTLPMRIERLLIYPLLLVSFQMSGGAVAMRRWLESRARRGSARPMWPGRLGRLIPHAWRDRLSWHELWVISLFVLGFETALALLYLPFDFYSGFVLAHQFGLSIQTVWGWASDGVKSFLLTLLLTIPLWTGFYLLIRLMPRRWPIPAGALMVALSAVMTLITPVLITPLFYEVRPLEDSDLRGRVLALAGRAGMHVDEVYVLYASAKTTRVNAYFTGFGDARRIVLYDTLLTDYTPDQVEVVLAHEMGHWYYRHVLLGLLASSAAGWIGLFGLRWLLNRTWRPLGLSGPADVAGLPYIIAATAIVTTLALPIFNGLSRYGERQADAFSLATSRKPQVFIDLFEKFAVQNLSVVDVPAWEKLVFYTHPPIVERIHMAEMFEGE